MYVFSDKQTIFHDQFKTFDLITDGLYTTKTHTGTITFDWLLNQFSTYVTLKQKQVQLPGTQNCIYNHSVQTYLVV